MENITSVAALRDAIEQLETDQIVKRQLLKEQLLFTYESLKPLNLLKNALKDISSTPGLMDNVLGTTLGLASGYLSKKLFIGTSGSLIRKLLGSVLQFGVTSMVAKHPDEVKSFGQSILQHLLRKKETNHERTAR
jgi:hypothetical protein